MKIFASFALASSLAILSVAAQAETASITAGKTLYGANGLRIASIYRVTADGSAQVIIDGKIYTIPAANVSQNAGKLTASVTRHDVLHAR